MSKNAVFAQVGQAAPDFSLKDNFGDRWRLSDKRGSVVLLLFYPANETLMCTKQLCSVRDNWAMYLETKAEVVGVSTGSPAANKTFAENHRLPLTILADEERSVTAMYSSHRFFPLNFMRGLAVIDAEGIVRTQQTMLRAFRPDDHDLILSLYRARSDASELEREELRTRVKEILLR